MTKFTVCTHFTVVCLFITTRDSPVPILGPGQGWMELQKAIDK
jgi:hypothetical protein